MAMQPVGGGGGGGTGTYEVLYQKPDILVQGVNNVVDAETVTVRDAIYGVIFSFTRSVLSWEGGKVQAAASFFAGNIQALAAYRHVVGISYTQDTSLSGNLIDQLIVTVGSDDGNQEASFVWPLETVDSQAVYAKADAVFAQLMAVANSTGA
jgi:uncharacterized protein YheU (UPF0270 family)